MFLGPTIGAMDIMDYQDADGSCKLSVSGLERACHHEFGECMTYLEAGAWYNSVEL